VRGRDAGCGGVIQGCGGRYRSEGEGCRVRRSDTRVRRRYAGEIHLFHPGLINNIIHLWKKYEIIKINPV